MRPLGLINDRVEGGIGEELEERQRSKGGDDGSRKDSKRGEERRGEIEYTAVSSETGVVQLRRDHAKKRKARGTVVSDV